MFTLADNQHQQHSWLSGLFPPHIYSFSDMAVPTITVPLRMSIGKYFQLGTGYMASLFKVFGNKINTNGHLRNPKFSTKVINCVLRLE